MADKCVGDEGKLVMKDGVKTLYMNYTTVIYLELTSYMTRMWLYGEDMKMEGSSPTGTLSPVVFTSYYENEEGGYLTDVYNEGTLNYYPKEGFVQLVSDDAKWPARFKVPVMDAIGGGNFEQDAWLTLDWANAEKVSDETPDAPIGDALAELIQVAKTGEAADFTAQALYEDEEATQTQVNQAVEAIDEAIQGLETVGTIKTDLQAALEKAKACLMDADRYTAAALEALEHLYDEAKAVYEDPEASQEEVDAQVRILTYAVENLKLVEETQVERQGLHELLLAAANLAGRDHLYTKESLKALKAAIQEAEEVYNKEAATQEEINTQAGVCPLAGHKKGTEEPSTLCIPPLF